MGELREDAYVHKQTKFENKIVSVFHACLSTKDQQHILKTFKSPDSKIRLVICTVAFGMGVNIPDIRIVLHWGVCDTVLEYWQEVGRAGRDGILSYAYYYATRVSIAHATADMKTMCNKLCKGEEACFRHAVLSHMVGYTGVTAKEIQCLVRCTDRCSCNLCSCCNLCRTKCPCA